MKNSIITYLLGFFFLITCFKAISNVPPVNSNNICLQIEGKISNANEGSDGNCNIELLCNDKMETSLILNKGKKKFNFMLKKNHTYAIRVSKQGYVTKLIYIDTKMEEPIDEIYSFSFETKLVKEETATDKLNKDVLDFPIAYIHYDDKKDCYIHDKEYTSQLQKEISTDQASVKREE